MSQDIGLQRAILASLQAPPRQSSFQSRPEPRFTTQFGVFLAQSLACVFFSSMSLLFVCWIWCGVGVF